MTKLLGKKFSKILQKFLRRKGSRIWALEACSQFRQLKQHSPAAGAAADVDVHDISVIVSVLERSRFLEKLGDKLLQ